MVLAAALSAPVAAAASGWSVSRSLSPPGASSSSLSGVSCVSTKDCVAVGSFQPAMGASGTLAERWNGTRWSIQPMPPTASESGSLFGVSCPSATVCIAAGAQGGGDLEERWDGSTWSADARPYGPPLAGVSCVTSADCTAVGALYCLSGSCGYGFYGLGLEHWNGFRWSSEKVVRQQGAYPTGVSCPSRAACFAVGYLLESPPLGGSWSGAPLALRWNRGRWLVQSTLGHGGLSGVACWSASGCFAVGGSVVPLVQELDGGPPTAGRPLIEGWDGKRWSLTRGSTGWSGTLAGIACASQDACTAVGSGSSWSYAERWNGAGWSRQHTSRPIGAMSTSLSAVSCPSPTTCIAVGSYKDATGQQRALVERWTANGGSR